MLSTKLSINSPVPPAITGTEPAAVICETASFAASQKSETEKETERSKKLVKHMRHALHFLLCGRCRGNAHALINLH